MRESPFHPDLQTCPWSTSLSELVPGPVLLQNFKGHNFQKLIDKNLKCIYIFIEQISLYQNIFSLVISVDLLLSD